MFKTLLVVIYYLHGTPTMTSQQFKVSADGCETVAEFVVESLASEGYQVSAVCVPEN